MARRSQCSSAGDNPLDPNYLPPHYREEYRLAIDALVEEDLEGYYQFLQKADVVDFLSSAEIQYIQESVQLPQQINHPEQRFLEHGGDGSSDTYWPIHSDLDAPGLDLGWPQLHHFIGPTEVTTLVNPPEPDMPSIKEQARRLIKNAQQVIGIVMDMFTDVDVLQDILNAAMRNVAVYILLDKQNVHHFVNMLSNCRVNIQNIQFLRVRTVSGITYHCRSGKSFKGQMMDRFLLTDCRAVLSGNYSFMWSFEKLHRCMAHLFLGQLVSTFDEEFRILYAQSEPLMIENMLPPMEEFGLLQKRQYTSERTPLYREAWKLRSLDTAHPEEWARHSYDERMDMDRRTGPLKRKEYMHGSGEIYNRLTPQHSFDHGPPRMDPAFKRHSYAEGGHGRYSFPFLPQQGMPEPENQGRLFQRGQQPYPGPGPGKEADYSAYEKFWNQGYNVADQYSEPDLPQEMEPPENFDPVLNYLSSTRHADFDQGSEKLPPAADLPFSSSRPRRLSLGQPFACQTSPTPSNPTEQKQFFQEPLHTDRKDPKVKRGLRDWRISSYLSAYDNPADEGLPLAPPNVSDAFEEPPNLMQKTTPGIDLSLPKIPNVREFKVPAIPRASQIPNYAKITAQEQPKKLPDEPAAVAAETKTTPTPSESSSTTEGEKTEEVEQKEPKTAILRRDESFRRKYNAAVPRGSRLRSSLLFSSLDQQSTSQDTNTTQQDEEGDKDEAEQTKLPFVSQVLRRSATREPFEWSRYVKSSTFENSAADSSKPDDGSSKADDKESSKDQNSKDLSEKSEAQESSNPPDVEQTSSSPSTPQSKRSEAELPKTDQPKQPPKSLLTSPFVDMNDPDMRLMFFKELAAKRKAAQAAEAEKSKEKVQMKPLTEAKDSTTVKKEETAEKMADTTTSEGLSAKDAGKTVSKEACKSISPSLDASDKANKDSQVKNDPSTTQSCKDSETIEPKNRQSEATLPLSAESEGPQSDPKLSHPAVEKSSPSHPPTPTNTAPANVPSLAQGTDKSENPCLDSTSKKSSSLMPSPVALPPSSAVDSNTQKPESVQLKISISSPSLLSEQNTGSDFSPSNKSVQSSSSDHIMPHSGSQISASPSAETISSKVTPEDPSSTVTSSFAPILSPNVQEAVSPVAQSDEETSQKSSVSQAESESVQPHVDPISQLTSSESPSAVDSIHVESDISLNTCTAGSEPNTFSLQSATKTDSEESCAATASEEHAPESENTSEMEVPGTSKDAKAVSTPPSLSPLSPQSCLPNVADLESKSRSDENETVIPAPSLADPVSEPSPTETSSLVHPDLTPNGSQAAPPQDATGQVTCPTKLNLTRSVTHSPAETTSCSPLTESVGSVLSPEASLPSPSDTNSLPEQVTTDSNEIPVLPSAETCSPTEPTSNIPTESHLTCKTPESVTSETHPSEPAAPAENSDIDSQNEAGQEKTDDTEAPNKVNKTTTQESTCSEKTNDQVRQNNGSEMPEITSDEVVPLSPQSKQPKSRYQSSTANVLSSSNLRDDTKLLLEQISANSQSRSEATKEAPVTDDEKEDEADKNAKREKERGIGSLSRAPPKSTQEREKLLERIQSMRKERKVYSRFEMAP